MSKKHRNNSKEPGVNDSDDMRQVTYVVSPGVTLNTLNSGVLVSGKPITVGSITPGNAGATDAQKLEAKKNFKALIDKGFIVPSEPETDADTDTDVDAGKDSTEG